MSDQVSEPNKSFPPHVSVVRRPWPLIVRPTAKLANQSISEEILSAIATAIFRWPFRWVRHHRKFHGEWTVGVISDVRSGNLDLLVEEHLPDRASAMKRKDEFEAAIASGEFNPPTPPR